MRKAVLWLMIMGCVPVWTDLARADEEVQVRPIDAYLSLYGGVASPFKTDVTESSPFASVTAKDSKLENSASIGGKAGLWFTAPRKSLGLDFGLELDVTSFGPDQKAGQVLTTTSGFNVVTSSVNLNATLIGVNFLARLPMGATADLPNGRWYPYLGIGGGLERLTFQTATSTEARDSSPAFQGLGGIKVFLFKHLAVFAEAKFTHASHTFEFQGAGVTAFDKLTVNTLHGIGGLSFHF